MTTRQGRREFGALRKLPSGRWQARYLHAGRTVLAPSTFVRRSDATAWLAGARADLLRGTWHDPEAGRETLAEYAAGWVATRRVRGRPLAPRTVELYQQHLRLRILPALGRLPLRDIDRAAVRTWYAGLDPDASARPKCYRLLHAILATAVADDKIARNPVAIVGAGQEATPERPMISVAQLEALADAVDERWRALVLLAGWCGLRFGELSALTRAHLDLLHGTVTVVASAGDVAGHRVIGPPKSPASRRTVAIPPHIQPALRQHLERFGEPGPTGLVFTGSRGGPLRRNNFSGSVWLPAARQVGLPDGAHFHDLRGTAATLAALSGATIAELLARLGHARIDVAMRYQRATADRDAALAVALSKLAADGTAPRAITG